MEVTPDSIQLVAKRGFLIYADGYSAQIISMKFGENQSKEKTFDFVLSPTDELIKRYNLKPNKNPAWGMMYQEQYPFNDVECLNVDPSWTRYFYIKTFDGKSTPAMDNLAGVKLKETIKKLMLEIRATKEAYLVMKEERDILKSNMPAYLEKNLKPLIDVVTPLIKEGMKKD